MVHKLRKLFAWLPRSGAGDTAPAATRMPLMDLPWLGGHAAYKPAVIANAILVCARTRGISIDHLKLQKLVFFVHVWSLTQHGDSVLDERPEAWKYGPVFESLYLRLEKHGNSKLRTFILSFDPVSAEIQAMVPSKQDELVWAVVNQVMDRYGSFTSLQLSSLGHEAGGPWVEAREMRELHISNNRITHFYAAKLSAARAAP